jgi:uncharacterized protein (DUF433 family)
VHLRPGRRLGIHGELVVSAADGTAVTVPGGQGVLEGVLLELTDHVSVTRDAWESKVLAVPEHPHVVTNARILGGAATVRGTRIETALVASFATDRELTGETVGELCRLYPALTGESIEGAARFEGVRLVA